MKKLLLFIFVIAGAAGLWPKQSHSQNYNINLVGQLSYGSEALSNIHGWVDNADGKEYALVGAENGLSIVDITVPSAPVAITQIPGPASTWREIKTWGDYAYVTTEDGTIGLQIVELTNLPATNLAVATWTPTIGAQILETIHALHIDNGKVYLYGTNVGNQGAIIADVVTTPMLPIYLGSYDARYIHDGYVRNDTLYAGHIYDGDCEIVDCSNPASPVVLGDFNTPGMFTHNTWLSANSKICFTTDEVKDSYLASFDISNLSNISELDRIQTSPGSDAVVHNTHIIQDNNNDYAVTSWYTEGFTIVDCGRPDNLVEVGHYDTSPLTASAGMNGDWGVFPFFPSGTIVASDMQEGLMVFTPVYTRACYLEGVVTNCSNGNPLPGVNVVLQVASPSASSNTDITDFQGQYAVGIALPDTYLVVFSKIGYMTDTDTVVLSTGIVTIDSFQLCPLPIFPVTGNIYDNATSTGIPNASVAIYDNVTRWDTVTDANGNFTIPTMFNGIYSIAAGKWGYVTKCNNNQNISPTYPPVSMGLNKGYYDDFTWDWGWTVSGNAIEGIWERGEPNGTTDFSGQPVNPDFDSNTDCSVQAYVTGNNGVSTADDDVDGGSTLLASPVFDLSAYTAPYIFYSRWKRLSFNSTDTVIIKISNGTTTATLENVLYSTVGQATWNNRNYKISNFVTPTATMSFSIQVSDLNSDNTNEGGLDKFYILDSTNSSVNEIENMVNVIVYPNPFNEKTILRMMNVQNTNDYNLKVYDIYCKEVKVDAVRSAEGFAVSRKNISSGIYFYQLLSKGEAVARGKMVIE